ncbi:MAG: ribosome recycling factor [Bacteroidetes bacterium]|jgi:ribosome recycling factor|nr:ribosome recycling factor [Bacteroidota bacterium]MBT3424226.1 ribosome recycling factor [Bacteroidota bacterium]MBT3801487.1 ribosome recycling factor [Bacteroidota bacterium]MBT3934660.1 ribosome recycling factor [Bacteroidota bacterium]MBT4337140.1 ribosome recycling factor [Bacteroidota bacterium]
MNEDMLFIIEEGEDQMKRTITHLIESLNKVRAGKASPQMISDVYVDYYGAKTPLSQTANVNTPDPKTIMIQPWDKAMIQPIEKAIMASNLGFNPQNDGEVIRINVPPLTEERRKQLVKYINQEAENNRISIRNTRKKANDEIKVIQKDGASEDDAKNAESKIQDLTTEYIKNIDDILAKKETEILTV